MKSFHKSSVFFLTMASLKLKIHMMTRAVESNKSLMPKAPLSDFCIVKGAADVLDG